MQAIEHRDAVSRSRAALLEEIGDDRELTLVRGLGNLGDELIRAGTHRLLDGRIYREIELDELPSSTGDTVLLPGSGAWCRPYHEWMPRALAVAELRFDRVIVLPSSFDVGEDSVRDALSRTRATVFARETESLRRIEGLCRARAAHDCAFFVDYSSYGEPGEGTLNAFRCDREAIEGELGLEDNNDISLTADSLEDWLGTIERHAHVRTDRAHVMIAAALLGKQVEVAPSNYHKIEAIVASSLRGFPVRLIEAPRKPAAAPRPVSARVAATREVLRNAAVPASPVQLNGDAPRVTAVILTRDRPELAAGAVRSVTAANVPARVLVVDNNSAPARRRALAALIADDPRVEIRSADRNLGCAGGRRLGLELVETEMVLFLDDDAELIDGALEHMVADLDAHPEAAGVTALVVDGEGTVQHYGGWIAVSDETAAFELDASRLRFDDPSLAPTGPSGWAPGTASLLRTRMLREVPIDEQMSAYYEDNDWCHRIERLSPGSFRRCREALVLHHHDTGAIRPRFDSAFSELSAAAERLAAHAHFYRANRVVLDLDLAELVPELRLADGSTDLAAARLLLELVAARGTDWTVMEWMNGGLARLFDGRRETSARYRAELGRVREESAAREAHLEQVQARAAALETQAPELHATIAALEAERAWLQQRHETLARVEAGGWWRLRARLLPLLRVAASVRAAMRARR